MTEHPDSSSSQGGDQPERSKGAGDPGRRESPRSEEPRRHDASSTASTRTAEEADSAAEDVDESTGLRSIASLQRLRDRVEVAAREMVRLREQNQELAERVKELESRPTVEAHGTFLSLDHDPELLKRKITGFIEAIDDYLEKESERG